MSMPVEVKGPWWSEFEWWLHEACHLNLDSSHHLNAPLTATVRSLGNCPGRAEQEHADRGREPPRSPYTVSFTTPLLVHVPSTGISK